MVDKPTYEDLQQRVKELEEETVKLKRIEEKLRESEERFRAIFDQTFQFIGLMTTDGILIEANRASLDFYGISESDVLGKLFWEAPWWTHSPELQNTLRDAVRRSASGEFVRFEAFHPAPDGTIKYVDISIKPLRDKAGNIYMLIPEGRDITERKQTEEAIQKLATVVKHSSELVNIATLNGMMIFLNEAGCEMLGIEPEKVANVNIMEVIPDHLKGLVENELLQTLMNGDSWEGDLQYRNIKTGGLTDVHATTFTVKDPYTSDPQYLANVSIDITKRKRAEEALRESEKKLARLKKMESIGLLAGGVAHDLNNVLSGVISVPELILMDLPQDSKLRDPVKTMLDSGHRAVAIVQDLLTVARGVATIKEPLNLNDVIDDYLSSPEFKQLEQFQPTVMVKTNLDTDLLNVGGSHVHIRKVVMNLVSNAAEAIEGSGIVTISTINLYIDRPIRGYEDVKIGEYAVLSVSDDGSGISLTDLERIFEPFYTKKVMGRSGTGLGLAVVWNIVQDHKGYIDVSSGEKGTTFKLYFPITRDEVIEKDLSIPMEDYKGGGETVLVVDDIDTQREITCNMLDKLGYEAKAVSSGEEAVAYLQERGVDIILLDMIMDPGINGRETYERIIKIHPKQKAIIVSGFTETDEVKETQRLGAGKYIKKPLTLQEIGLAIKEELKKP